MTTTAATMAEMARRFDRIVLWLAQKTQQAWDALARSASGEGIGGSGAIASDTGPAVVLMAGGLTTLAAMMALFMARRSLGSEPDPVKTRESRKKARESVDVYVEGDRNGASSSSSSAPAEPGFSTPNDPQDASGRDEAEGKDATQVAAVSVASNDKGPPRRRQAPDGRNGMETLETAEVEAVQAEADARQTVLAHERAFQRGQSVGERIQASDAREVLEHIQSSDLGDPKLIRSSPNLYEIQLDDCRGCRSHPSGNGEPNPQAGCPFEAGILEGSMSRFTPGGVVVRESACRRWGDEACVFEVWY